MCQTDWEEQTEVHTQCHREAVTGVEEEEEEERGSRMDLTDMARLVTVVQKAAVADLADADHPSPAVEEEPAIEAVEGQVHSAYSCRDIAGCKGSSCAFQSRRLGESQECAAVVFRAKARLDNDFKSCSSACAKHRQGERGRLSFSPQPSSTRLLS